MRERRTDKRQAIAELLEDVRIAMEDLIRAYKTPEAQLDVL